MRWYEHVTESQTFKRLDNPATTAGAVITAIIAITFSIVAYIQNPNPSHDCSSNPLRQIYNPARLKILATCQTIQGTVTHVTKERDGDLHIQLKTNPKWVNQVNRQKQAGNLVIEFLPSDPYPKPTPGQQLKLNCTWVSDLQHGGWNEGHPCFSDQPLGSAANTTQP